MYFCKQKTAYEMRISDWSSDVCSSDLTRDRRHRRRRFLEESQSAGRAGRMTAAGVETIDYPFVRLAFYGALATITLNDPERLNAMGDEMAEELGRATCRDRVCQYVYISGVAVQLKIKQT